MNSIDLETELANLWASIIRGLNIDLCKHCLSLDLAKYKTDDIDETVTLVFTGVSAFYFVNDSGQKRLITNDWEKAEISEMHYLNDGLDKVAYKNSKLNMPSVEANVNFYIEIWSSLLLIEAKAVEINGIKVQVSD
jgi:hypothetical protein